MIKEPTAAQYKTIANLINQERPDEFYVDFIREDGQRLDGFELTFPRGNHVILKIKEYFADKPSLKESVEDAIEVSKKTIEDQLGVPYEQAISSVTSLIEQRLKENDFDIEITGIDFTGSRRFGKPLYDSDLDVKFTYHANYRAREDDLFNCLNDENYPLYYKGFKLDINPIEDGDLDYLIKQDSAFRKRESLEEDTRGQFIAKSRGADVYKDQSMGKNRFERKRRSKVANQVKSYNKIDMNKLFKQDILEIDIPVVGETNTYDVTVRLEGVIAEMAREIKNNNNIFEFKVALQALTKIFNTTDVKVRCSCPDFAYRYQHNLIINNNSVDGTDKDPGPGKTGMTAQMKGQGCKHVLLVLANCDWIMKVASVIHNYVHYAEEHLNKAFQKIIFPKLYGMIPEDAVDANLLPEDVSLDTEKHLIDAINDWAKNRGKIQKGSNKNPATGKGKMLSKQ